MKILILMVSLLTPVHTFANVCDGDNNFTVRYVIRNHSEYTVGLKFDQARQGNNPGDIYVKPYGDPVNDYGCSDKYDMFGYVTRATVTASLNESGPSFDLGYIFIDDYGRGAGIFSFEKYNIDTPECQCKVRAGAEWANMKIYDCLSYNERLRSHMELSLTCK